MFSTLIYFTGHSYDIKPPSYNLLCTLHNYINFDIYKHNVNIISMMMINGIKFLYMYCVCIDDYF